MMLRIRIKTHTSTQTVEVHPSTHIGSFLFPFVRALRYPTVDTSGTPLSYCLRLPSKNGHILPNEMSFAELNILPDSLLVLDIPATQADTLPLFHEEKEEMMQKALVHTWTRRSFLLATLCIVCGGSGLTLGATTAFIQGTARSANASKKMARQKTLPTKATKYFTFSQHTQQVRAVSWSLNGMGIASGSDDANVLVWSPNGVVRQRLMHPAQIRAVTWSPDGQRLAVGSGNEIIFWQVPNGIIVNRSLGTHTAPVTSIAWASSGEMHVVSAAEDARAVVWSSKDYHIQTIFPLHTTPIESVSIAFDGTDVATASSGGLARIWNLNSGLEKQGYYESVHIPMRSVAFSPVEPRLAIGGEDGQIRLWNNGLTCTLQKTGIFGVQCIDTPMELHAHTKSVRVVAWSRNGQMLASGGEDGLLAVWDLTSSQRLLFTVQNSNPVLSLCWGDNDRYIASTSGNTVIIWSLE